MAFKSFFHNCPFESEDFPIFLLTLILFSLPIITIINPIKKLK